MTTPGRALTSLLLSAALLAQTPLQQELTAGIDRMVALAPDTDGAWIGLGPDYKVHFGADHFTFVPMLGMAAPRDLPLQMTIRALGRDTLRPVGPANRLTGNARVEYARPELVEVLELRPEGLKQSFVLQTLPAGHGDLVVRADVTTELIAARGATTGPLPLSMPGAGGVTIGEVTGIDADGRQATGSMRWHGDAIDFVLPAAFVETARLPLTVDPLLATTTTVTTGPLEERAPAVAHIDTSLDMYLVVWRRTFSAANHDLLCHRVSGTMGLLLGSLLPIEVSAADAGEPQVAEVHSLQWVVVWAQGGDIRGARVLPSAGLVTPFSITTSPDNEVTPDIGGMVNQPLAAVTWRNATANTIEVVSIGVGTTIAIAHVITVATSSLTTSVSEPSLSQSNASQRALLTYHNNSTLLGQQSVRGQLVSIGVGLLGSTFAIAGNATLDAFNPACAGDGTVFVVAYETNGLLGDGLSCVSVRQRNNVVELGQPRSLTPLGSASANPAVAWFDGSALVAWTRPNGAQHDVLVSSIDPLTCSDCEGTQVVDTGNNTDQVAVCSTFAHVSSPNQDRGLIAYADVTANAQVKVRHYQAIDGVQNPLGGGCGATGRTYGSSARVGNANFGFQLVGGTPAELSLLLLSTAAIPGGFSCGTCTLHPDFSIGVIEFTGVTSATGSARFDLPIPAQANLVGLSLFGQFARFASNCLGSFELSPALRVQLQ